MSSSDRLPSDEVAIVFADVSGATTLFDTLGNTAAWEIVSRCLQLVMDEVERFDGEVIKTIGDEVMCKFPTAEQAVRATKAMQKRLLADGDVLGAGNDSAVKMRIGFNYGAVLKQGKDVIGDAVNVAARMASSANPGQILTTAETIAHLPANVLSMTRSLGRIPVKGKADYIDAYEVVWGEEGDYTEVVPKTMLRSEAIRVTDLRLVYGKTTKLLDGEHGKLTLGRSEEAGLPVADPGPGIKTSRTHATIERVRGRYMLTDLSANGTYVETASETRRLERNQTMELNGKGKISLGRPFEQGGLIISYELVLSKG